MTNDNAKSESAKPHLFIGHRGSHRRGHLMALAMCVGLDKVMRAKQPSTHNPVPDPLPSCPRCQKRNMVLIVATRPHYRCERCNYEYTSYEKES